VSKAREQTEKAPKDSQAWRDLSTALQTDGQTDEAIVALNEYVTLKPKDPDGLRELAGLYLAQASQTQQDAQLLQIRAAYAAAGQNFPGSFAVGGRSIVDDKIGSILSQQSSTAIQEKIYAAQASYDAAVQAYKKIAVLQPTDPNVQLELAQAAQQASDTAAAIAAYEKFLELAPEDPSAPIVKQQLKQLKASSG
jgi:Flp pilus assembly protein TadD